MPFNPQTPDDVAQMLATIGAKSIDELFEEIPKDLRIESLAGIPDSLSEMQKVGNNLFKPTGSVKPLELSERNVRQGYLEMSGASPVRQMMAMIETTRAFEANSRMIQNQDSMIGSLISRVLQA